LQLKNNLRNAKRRVTPSYGKNGVQWGPCPIGNPFVDCRGTGGGTASVGKKKAYPKERRGSMERRKRACRKKKKKGDSSEEQISRKKGASPHEKNGPRHVRSVRGEKEKRGVRGPSQKMVGGKGPGKHRGKTTGTFSDLRRGRNQCPGKNVPLDKKSGLLMGEKKSERKP